MQSEEIEKFLIKKAFDFRHDPLSFVKFAWDDITPHDWQKKILIEIGDKLKSDSSKGRTEAIQEAVASGHGIGKSCLVSWLTIWGLCTEVDTKGVVTANTENQLKTKTWAELAKWYNSCRYKHWFKFTATALFSSDPDHERLWRIDMIPWSERNTEAFAGLHNAGKRILCIFDEASAVPDVIWEVAEGALTDENTEIIWIVFGNPTRNTGRFRECFGKFKHRWFRRQVDSRTVPGVNKTQINKWAEDYGDDSDFFRVRVKGVFPRAGNRQFIALDVVEKAIERKIDIFNSGAAKIMSVDVARFGDDQSVVGLRCGRRLEPLIKFRGLDTMQLSSEISSLINKNNPDAVFVDGVGVGGGVVDRLKSLGFDIIDVNAGRAPDIENKDTHFNKRVEMWDRMREWLIGADIPDDDDLKNDLIGIEYGFDNKMKMQLEKKSDMKKRGLSSPDCADAVSMGFYSHVSPVGCEVSLEAECYDD